MDLGSTNGTFINEDRIESHRYYELFERDNIKFGNSSREYVLLHENSTDWPEEGGICGARRRRSFAFELPGIVDGRLR